MNWQGKTNEQLRAMHTCMKTMSSMNCLACNRGVPYPAMTVEEIEDSLASGRRESQAAERALLTRPGRRR